MGPTAAGQIIETIFHHDSCVWHVWNNTQELNKIHFGTQWQSAWLYLTTEVISQQIERNTKGHVCDVTRLFHKADCLQFIDLWRQDGPFSWLSKCLNIVTFNLGL